MKAGRAGALLPSFATAWQDTSSFFGLVVDVRPSEFVCLWQIDVSDRRDTLFGEVCLHLIFKFGGVEVVFGGVVVDQGVQVVCGDGARLCGNQEEEMVIATILDKVGLIFAGLHGNSEKMSNVKKW